MRQISGKWIIAMMVMMIFTMTACKNKKPVVDPLETLTQVAVEDTTTSEDRQEEQTSFGEGIESEEDGLLESSTASEEETTDESSGIGNQRPGDTGNQSQTGSQGGATGNQGQTGPVGNHQTAGSSGWETEESPKYPWDLGCKQPTEYTWEEYLELSAELKDAFLRSFSDVRDYERWRDEALKKYNEGGDIVPPDEDWEEPTEEQSKLELPWEKTGAKQPSEYTWAEFQALSPELQMAFQNSFSDIDAFEAWMQNAQGGGSSEEKMPWDEAGAKQPSEYTWAEFQALTPDQQMAFQNWFASMDDFEAWLRRVQPQESGSSEEKMPWDEAGAKKPSEYTWAEFEALTSGQQMAFQNWFSSIDEFDAWMKQAQGVGDPEDEDLPWENGGKQPSEYTWAEFEALSPAQQMAFQNWFDSIDEFDAWMQRVQGDGSLQEKMPWEEEGAKQPSEYTWAEFEALSPAQQIAFQNWFGDWEDFDKWLTANQP